METTAKKTYQTPVMLIEPLEELDILTVSIPFKVVREKDAYQSAVDFRIRSPWSGSDK